MLSLIGSGDIPTITLREQVEEVLDSRQRAQRLFAAPAVRSDAFYKVELDLDGVLPEGMSPGRAAYTLIVNNETVQTIGHTWLSANILSIEPYDSSTGRLAAIFSQAIGFAKLEVRVSGFEFRKTVEFEPVQVLLPESRESQELQLMAEAVASGYDQWLSTEKVTTEEEAPGGRISTLDPLIANRIKRLEHLLRVFEKELPYFSSNARFELRSKKTIDAIAKLRGMSAETAAFIATHPEELRESRFGAGIRIGKRFYVPQHTLVESTRRNYDLYENRVIAGFLVALASALKSETELVSNYAEPINRADLPQGYISAGSVLRSSSARRLSEYAYAVSDAAERVRGLARRYAAVFGIAFKAHSGIPKRTPVFQSIPSYRRIYEAIVRWYQLGELRLHKEELMANVLCRSRLYEVYVLVRLLDEIQRFGFSLIERYEYEYDSAMHLQSQRTLQKAANTFVFKANSSNSVRLTLFYEPVVPVASKEPENGLGLVRTTSFQFKEGNQVDFSPNPSKGFTPDYVLKLEVGDRIVWYLADAKYTTRSIAAERYLAVTALKYILGTTTSCLEDRVAGLWLMCGRGEGKRFWPSSFNSLAESAHVTPCGDIYLDSVRVSNSLEENKAIPALVQALMRFLQNDNAGIADNGNK